MWKLALPLRSFFVDFSYYLLRRVKVTENCPSLIIQLSAQPPSQPAAHRPAAQPPTAHRPATLRPPPSRPAAQPPTAHRPVVSPCSHVCSSHSTVFTCVPAIHQKCHYFSVLRKLLPLWKTPEDRSALPSAPSNAGKDHLLTYCKALSNLTRSWVFKRHNIFLIFMLILDASNELRSSGLSRSERANRHVVQEEALKGKGAREQWEVLIMQSLTYPNARS